MSHEMTPQDARSALDDIELRRSQVIAEIDMPRWYWVSIALAWIGLGCLTDLRHPAATFVATIAFAIVHAIVSHVLVAGRRRSRHLSVGADLAGRSNMAVVGLFLAGLTALTVVGAMAASADGSRHPVTTVSLAVATVVLLGGPRVMNALRQHALHHSSLL